METFYVSLEEVLHHNVTLEEIIPTLKEKWVGRDWWKPEPALQPYPSGLPFSVSSPELRQEVKDQMTLQYHELFEH